MYIQMQLTGTEKFLAAWNLKQAQDYIPDKLLTLQEQVEQDLFPNINEYERVASTVEEPILDETNALYTTDGIDTDLLYQTLSLHSGTRGVANVARESDEEFADKNITPKFSTFKITSGTMDETWIQNDYGNRPRHVEDMTTQEEEDRAFEQDRPDVKGAKLYAKQQKLEKDIMITLSNLWKDYHYRNREKNVATGERYLMAERNVKNVFIKIKKMEQLKEKFEVQMENQFFKHRIVPQMDELLDRYVERQQRQLEKGLDPEMSREDAIRQLQPKFSRYIERYDLYCKANDRGISQVK